MGGPHAAWQSHSRPAPRTSSPKVATGDTHRPGQNHYRGASPPASGGGSVCPETIFRSVRCVVVGLCWSRRVGGSKEGCAIFRARMQADTYRVWPIHMFTWERLRDLKLTSFSLPAFGREWLWKA